MFKLFSSLVLALACGAVCADGVPLLTATNATAADSARLQVLRSQPLVANAITVAVNRFAIDSNIITANVGGKEQRFVGQRVNTGVPDTESWSGQSGSGQALLVRSKDGVSGSITVGQKNYQLQTVKGRSYLTEMKPSAPLIEEPTPEMIAAQRARNAANPVQPSPPPKGAQR